MKRVGCIKWWLDKEETATCNAQETSQTESYNKKNNSKEAGFPIRFAGLPHFISLV
jgi:hypothetical protein